MIQYENLSKLNAPFKEEFIDSFANFINTGWFILGNEVKKFEQNFASYNNSNYCIGVANGLDALTISLKVFNFKEGSEVIVPSNTYIATILSILNCGLIPILVEPNINTYNIDPQLIEKSITPKTVAIMIVHLYGKSCEMDIIQSIANKYQLRIIEDCAQAHGAMYKNRKVGTFGTFGAFSFYPTKNLGALGDAGAITTDDEDLSLLVKKIRNYGSQKKYYNDIIGVNSRLDELQAQFLDIKLKYLDIINNHKRNLAKLYLDNLKDDFIKPHVSDDHYDVFHIFNIRHTKRDELKEFLFKNNIQTEIHYPVPPNEQIALKSVSNYFKNDYPISKIIHNTTLSLPISYSHSENDIYKVIEILNQF
jgi:dTDP-4-amino-4,6-dideoxygalactose transaminase